MFETQRRNYILPYLNIISGFVVLGLFLVYLNVFTSLDSDKSGLYLLSLLMLIQLTPPLMTFSRGQFNFLVFVLINHFVVYSVAKYNLLINVEKTASASTDARNAITEMIYCTLLIIFSYYIVRYLTVKRTVGPPKYQMFRLPDKQYFWLGIFVFTQPFVYLYLPPSLSTIHLVAAGSGIILLFCSHCKTPLLERYVKVGLLISAYYSFLKTGSLAMFGSLATILFIVTFIQWKLRNVIILGSLAFLGVCIQTVKADYRIVTRSVEMSTLDEVVLLNELLVWKFLEGGGVSPMAAALQMDDDDSSELPEGADGDVSDTLAKGFSRVGDDSLERVLAMTPSRVPFWEGETYSHIPYIFIPRLLWPGKPKREMWNKFGRVYGFLSEDDDSTSVGVNFLGEAYMNFGFTGLYFVALLFGGIIALMESLSYYYLSAHCFFSFICFLVPVMGYGLDLGSILNGIVLIISILMAIRYRLVRLLKQDPYAS